MAIVFWVCAILSVLGGFGMVVSRKAVHSALWLALTMVNLAVLYVSQNAEFLGIVQIVVYTGAVMMLFLFVLMIVGVDSSDSLVETIRGHRLASIAAIVVLASLVTVMVVEGVKNLLVNDSPVGLEQANAFDGGNVAGIARLLFGRYVFAFEATSALLITAVLGAMVLAHRERFAPAKTQEMLSRERLNDPANAAGLPAPGVYARHNSVSTPALLPDGSTAESSIMAPLAARGVVDDVREYIALSAAADAAVTEGEGENS
jgi:NADH-quinone oxidoreductase subunit J